MVLLVWGAAAVAALSGAQAPAQTPTAPPPAPVSFAKDIFPVLEANCLACHGATMQLARLDLRTRESALAGGAHGAAIVPGNAEQSRLFRRITGAEAPAMPMSGDPLTPDQIAAIKAWLDQGAAWEATTVAATPASAGGTKVPPLLALERMDITPEQRNYWAFKLPLQAPVPVVAATDLTNPIDRFLEKTRVERRLKAAPRAPRLTLVRRAYLDLLGLPPTPAQVAEFMADETPQAWERLIDRLLASPHYGERYGRHWLDVARYADSGGFEYDVHRPNAWRYRDYVIKSFNDDKPYNQFLVEQLAGDEMDWKTDQTLDRHRVPAHGTARAVPRERQSGAPLRLPRRDHRHHRQRDDGADGQLRALPQPQVRSDRGEGLLRDAGVAVRLRRDGGAARAARRGGGLPGEERRDQCEAGRAEVGDRRDREAAPRHGWSSSRFARGSPHTSTGRPRNQSASARPAKSCSRFRSTKRSTFPRHSSTR